MIRVQTLTSPTPITFLAPAVVEVPTPRSSHRDHLTPGRASAKISTTFLHAVIVEASGVEASAAWRTGTWRLSASQKD